MVRRLLLLAMLLSLALILVPRLFKRYPVQAIVNAPAVELRAPVESVVVASLTSSGRFEEQPADVVVLRLRLADELAALEQQDKLLQRRLSSFLAEEKKRLEQELAAREGELRRAELDQASGTRELQRQQSLVSAGFISANQLDNATLRQESAGAARDIARAHVQRARSNLEALTRQGFIGERAGGSDVTYTQQKLDEVRLRIAELRSWASRLGAAQAAGALADTTALRTPGRGLLMGPYVTEGAFLGAGDLAAHYVLCERAFVDLAVPVMDLHDYRQGGSLSFRVAGEWQFYQGQVQQIFPMHASAQKMPLAVQPDQNEQALARMARVWVRPDDAFMQRMRQESNCMMGQKLHAQLPGQAGGVPRWLSFLADVF